jgi:hypothetical protein
MGEGRRCVQRSTTKLLFSLLAAKGAIRNPLFNLRVCLARYDLVTPYGACVPTYCDWGTIGVNFEGEPFTIKFLFDGSRLDACCTGAPNTQIIISFANADKTELQVVDDGFTNNMHRG